MYLRETCMCIHVSVQPGPVKSDHRSRSRCVVRGLNRGASCLLPSSPAGWPERPLGCFCFSRCVCMHAPPGSPENKDAPTSARADRWQHRYGHSQAGRGRPDVSASRTYVRARLARSTRRVHAWHDRHRRRQRVADGDRAASLRRRRRHPQRRIWPAPGAALLPGGSCFRVSSSRGPGSRERVLYAARTVPPPWPVATPSVRARLLGRAGGGSRAEPARPCLRFTQLYLHACATTIDRSVDECMHEWIHAMHYACMQ